MIPADACLGDPPAASDHPEAATAREARLKLANLLPLLPVRRFLVASAAEGPGVVDQAGGAASYLILLPGGAREEWPLGETLLPVGSLVEVGHLSMLPF